MCQKIPKLIRMYAVIHHPTHMARPVTLGVFTASKWNDPLFKKYVDEADEIVKKYGGGNHHMLSKRDLERWGTHVPCGARAEVVEFDIVRPMS
jgi:hypothetical protein